jgi:hypothetical protein
MTTAITAAERYWNASPCGGNVALTWRAYSPRTEEARAFWANPLAFYGYPELKTDCAIVFNSRPRFCTVVVHEYGRLTGHPHSDDPLDVMADDAGDAAHVRCDPRSRRPETAPLRGLNVTPVPR